MLTTSPPPLKAETPPPPGAAAGSGGPAAGRHDAHFRTDHLKGELKRRAVRGGAVTMLSQVGKFALSLGSTFVLARLLKLGPGDYGVIAMVVTVTGLIRVFNDLGLSRATVQRAQISHEQVTALFWVNAAVGLAGMLLAVALSPLVASFYGESRLLPVMAALSAGFVFSGLGAQHQAIMTRQMRFAALALIDVGAMAAGVAAAIVVAWRGGGYWALVALGLASALVQNVAVWVACGWVPGPPRRGAGVGSMLRFGANLAGFNVLNYVQRNADNVLIGRTLGVGALGLYDKAYHLLMLPIHQVNGPMSNIAIPSLSRLQDDPPRFRSYYRNAIEALVTVTMPAVVLLFVVADEVVLTLLGPHWLGAVPIFRWLAPAALVGTFHVATGWVYVSLGHTDRQLRMGLAVAPITVGGFAVGSLWGPIGVAASYSVTSLLLRYPTVAYCFRGTPLRPADLAAALWRPALASGLAGVGLFAFGALVPQPGNSTVRLLLQFATYAVLYPLSWCVLPGGRRYLADSFRLLGNLKAGGGGRPDGRGPAQRRPGAADAGAEAGADAEVEDRPASLRPATPD